MAADAICDGLETGDTSAAQLGRWGDAFNEGVDRMRRLVCEYYDGFSFGNFVRNYPHLRGKVTDLLIGDLFTDTVDKVWQPMESLYPPDKAHSPMERGYARGRGRPQSQRARAARRPKAIGVFPPLLVESGCQLCTHSLGFPVPSSVPLMYQFLPWGS